MRVSEFAAMQERWFDGNTMASNAPEFLRNMRLRLPDDFRRNMFRAAISSIADGDKIDFPARYYLVSLLQTFPELDLRVTRLLTSKDIPKTALELYQRVWRTEFIAVREEVRVGLQAELSRYT